MSEVTIIGIDLAKRVFQLHGALLMAWMPPPDGICPSSNDLEQPR